MAVEGAGGQPANLEGVVSGRVFTRASSGLVRQVGTLDTLYYSLVQAAPQFIFLVVAFWVLYPGASMELAIILSVAGAALVGIVYGLYASAYPRSGGEYVFMSRTVHPLIGFVLSFSLTFWQAWSVGTTAAILAIFALSPTFVSLGLQLDNQTLQDVGTWFGEPMGIFVTGATNILLFWYLLQTGIKSYFTFQRWLFALAYVSIGVMVVVLAAGALGLLSFEQNFNELVGAGAYSAAIENGTAAGADLTTGFDLGATLAFMIWPTESLLFAYTAVSFAGEVRNARRAPLVGIVGGVVVSGLILLVLAYLARLALGDDFIKAASYMTLGDAADQFPLPNAFLPLLAAILGGNGIVTVIINLWFVVLSIFLTGAVAIYASRALFAWGIDGMAPERLGEVSERHHSPTWSIAVTMIIGLATLFVFAFTDYLTVLSGLIGQGVVFLVVAIAGIFYPFRNREAYESSPARMSLLGIPVMTLAGIGGTVYMGWIMWRAFVDDTAAVNTPFSLQLTAVIFVAAVVWFYAVRYIQRRRGVNVDLRFREIPIE